MKFYETEKEGRADVCYAYISLFSDTLAYVSKPTKQSEE